MMEIDYHSAVAANAESSRSSVLDAALSAFVKFGYEETSVSDILRASGVSARTFYKQFPKPDKAAVFLSLVADRSLPLLRRLGEQRADARSLEELVGGICRTYFQFITNDPVLCRLLRNSTEHMRNLLNDPFIRSALDDLQRDLQRSMEAGTLPRVDADYLTASIVGVTFELGLRLLERDSTDIESATRFATGMIVGGVVNLGAASH